MQEGTGGSCSDRRKECSCCKSNSAGGTSAEPGCSPPAERKTYAGSSTIGLLLCSAIPTTHITAHLSVT